MKGIVGTVKVDECETEINLSPISDFFKGIYIHPLTPSNSNSSTADMPTTLESSDDNSGSGVF